MKVLSLFDGISIAQQALKELNIPVEKYYASEIDKYAIKITQKNFPNTIQLGDVRNISINNNHFIDKDIDLLIGGSPCQDLSIAKKGREGLAGSRSGLFFEYARILKEFKPKYFVLENVNSMPKEAKETISQELFGIQPIMINASLVSAQNRKRLFWVGKLVNGKYEQVNITLPEDRGILLRDILEQDVDEKYYLSEKSIKHINRETYGAKGKILDIESEKTPTLQAAAGTGGGNCICVIDNRGNEKLKSNTVRTSGRGSGIDDKHNWDTIRIGQIGNSGQGDRIYSQDGKSVALSANGGGRGAKTGLYAVRSNYNNTLNFDKANTLGSNSQCQTAKTGQGLVNLKTQQIRKLTPIECERLQSLPDNYTEGVSNTQRYKALGNGFNCEVIKHILTNLT